MGGNVFSSPASLSVEDNEANDEDDAAANVRLEEDCDVRRDRTHVWQTQNELLYFLSLHVSTQGRKEARDYRCLLGNCSVDIVGKLKWTAG